MDYLIREPMFNESQIAELVKDLISHFATFFVIIGLIFLGILIFFLICNIKYYQKMGKPGWAAIIPFYNNYVLVEAAGLNWWWFLIQIVPGLLGINYAALISLFVTFIINYNLAKKFHKETSFAVLMTIFPVVMIPIIALSKSFIFDSSAEVSNNGPFNETK